MRCTVGTVDSVDKACPTYCDAFRRGADVSVDSADYDQASGPALVSIVAPRVSVRFELEAWWNVGTKFLRNFLSRKCGRSKRLSLDGCMYNETAIDEHGCVFDWWKKIGR